MWKAPFTCVSFLFVLSSVNGDLYLHVPRGSNNRLNENTQARKNQNRLFDSQNNNNGGYNVGDATSRPSGNAASKQYQMKYFQSGSTRYKAPSILTIEWTNQHGCGGRARGFRKTNCDLILQYMCQPNDGSVSEIDQLRAGVNTQRQQFSYQAKFKSVKDREARKKSNVKQSLGLHESWESYDRCISRENNKGLFLADQKLNKLQGFSRAIHTRQNNNGQRYGYECPEERDYYPYWHPTSWIDIGVLVNDMSDCKKYRQQSSNLRARGECIEETPKGADLIRRSRWNNKEECEANKGKWVELYNFLERAPEFTSKIACLRAGKARRRRYIWGLASDTKNISKYECLVAADPLACRTAPYSRVNHLGNGLSGKANTFSWVLPNFPSGKEQRCVLRMRYNISTNDYDPDKTDASQNGKLITNDPTIKFGEVPLQLAINTAQFGRVFQDRSHVFLLKPRPNKIDKGRIFNLNVRGKRGNIVQVYPAVEYDFAPNRLMIKSTDYLHIQWTGSNTNPKNNAGEGTAGTDRSNLLQMKILSTSYPLPFEDTSMWNDTEIAWIHHGETGVSKADLAVDMASSGYYNCVKSTSCPQSIVSNSVDKKAALNNVLNNASASYGGVLLRFKKGLYNYMCTRNNNFTNRSQKGILQVV